MKDRKKKSASPPEAATPFFARYLEGQSGEDAEAKVTEHKGRARATARKVSKTTATKVPGGKVVPPKAVTLKYPSDNDELCFYPYHVEAATKGPGKGLQTLKFPSDNDEDRGLYAVYTKRSDVPKAAKVKAKDAQVHLTRKAPKSK